MTCWKHQFKGVIEVIIKMIRLATNLRGEIMIEILIQKRLTTFIFLCSAHLFTQASFQRQPRATQNLLDPKTLRSAATLATLAQYLLPNDILESEETIPINLSFNKKTEEFIISRAAQQPQSCKDFLKVTAQILTAQAKYMESKEKKAKQDLTQKHTSNARQRRRSITSSHSEEFDKNIPMQEIHIKQD
jgi:hypothetical protein